jgi:hypothetical protein
MKTLISDNSFESFINTYDDTTQNILISLDAICKKETKEVAKIFGHDIIGYGMITYSNTYLTNQPWFKVGFRVTKQGISLYLSAYKQSLYDLADQLKITYGKGCFYMKKKDYHRLESIETLIKHTLEN